jgi:energy-coupling factor transporter transmembrane protein EcfT
LFIIALSITGLLRLRLARILRPVLAAWLILLVAFAVHALVSYRSAAYWAISGDVVHQVMVGLERAALFTFRLGLMLLTMSMVFALHPPQRYGQAVVRLFARMPFGRKTLAQAELTGTLAVRFVPFVGSEVARLKLALAARGQPAGVTRLQRLKSVRKLLFPLLVAALRRADHAADALAVRGYDPSVIRTSLYRLPLRSHQLVLTAIFTLLCLAVPWI